MEDTQKRKRNSFQQVFYLLGKTLTRPRLVAKKGYIKQRDYLAFFTIFFILVLLKSFLSVYIKDLFGTQTPIPDEILAQFTANQIKMTWVFYGFIYQWLSLIFLPLVSFLAIKPFVRDKGLVTYKRVQSFVWLLLLVHVLLGFIESVLGAVNADFLLLTYVLYYIYFAVMMYMHIKYAYRQTTFRSVLIALLIFSATTIYALYILNYVEQLIYNIL